AVLGQRGLATPRVFCTASGDALTEISGEDGRRHFVWAVTYLPGVLLADLPHRSTQLLEDLGATIGKLTAVLREVHSPALEREFNWDLQRAAERVGMFDGVRQRVERYVQPYADALYRAVIHNDLNDHNILI